MTGPAGFYGPEQAAIHHEAFATLAEDAAALLLGLLAEAGLTTGTVVDLGSGSGVLARIVGDAGYDVVGHDISADMVEIARRHAPGATFHCGFLVDAEIPSGTVAVCALGEALNYATDPRAGLDQVERVAGRVRSALPLGGVFLLDVSTPGRAGPEGSLERNHEREAWSLRMRATESADGSTLERDITIRTRGPAGEREVAERHVLRLYRLDDVLSLLAAAGFSTTTRPGYGEAPTDLPGWTAVVARAV